MASNTNQDGHHEEKKAQGDVTEVVTASVALAAAVAAQNPSLLSKNMLKLYCIMAVGYLISTMNGFDGSLMSSINAMTSYQKSFGLNGEGSSSGIVFVIFNLGQIGAFPFCGLLADGYGRRVCIFVGCLAVIIGTIVQATCQTLNVFMGGRFILGFGVALATGAGPAYIVELAHPAYRGTMAGMYNNFWPLGNIIAGWATYGSNLHFPNSSWAWKIPTIAQAGIPALIMAVIMWFPESPRWLIAHDRREEALAIFSKYHGDGDERSPIVQLQYREIIEQINEMADYNKNPWWDYRELVNTRAARYRLFMVISMSFIGQWSGNNVISYFLPTMVKVAGIRDPNKQLLINAIQPIFGMLAAIYGATLLDRLGRRFMIMAGLFGALFSYILLTVFTAESANHPQLVYGVIVSIYLFVIFFSWGLTPLQALYAVECLENRTRAKGSGLNFLVINIALVVNTYGISVGIEAIGWYLYLVYIGWICIEIALVYFFFVETAGKTLEELAEIFDAPSPKKASIKREKVQIDEAGNVFEVEGQ